MLPKSFSASALTTAQLCLARYRAEYIDKAATHSGFAANLGTVLHGALEKFVRELKIKRTIQWEIDKLLEYYQEEYHRVFNSDMTWHKEGLGILKKWFERNYIFDDVIGSQTLSVEMKNSFDVNVEINGQKGKVPFNYIIDRMDRLGPGEYRVVDYKSQRVPVSVNEMHNHLQARAYALATQIKFKDAEKIWVELDFLRYDKVGVLFTRDNNIETWKMLKREAQRIVDTEADDAPETLNPYCTYCVRAATCKTLHSNINVGGIHSLAIESVAEVYGRLANQLKGLEQVKNELEKKLLLYASENDLLTFDTTNATVKVTSSSRRELDHAKVVQIIGPELASRYGTMRLGDVDELLASGLLTDVQKTAIQLAITRKQGNPTVKVTPRR